MLLIYLFIIDSRPSPHMNVGLLDSAVGALCGTYARLHTHTHTHTHTQTHTRTRTCTRTRTQHLFLSAGRWGGFF